MPEQRKGWFKIPGVQDGDRTLAEQLKGLGPLLAEATGKQIIDLGCAEGLIAKALIQAGAGQVLGVEVSPHAVGVALQDRDPDRFQVLCHDLNRDDTAEMLETVSDAVDIVLLLAVLHKLREPGKLVRAVARVKPGLIVVRLPPDTAPVIVDPRSGNRPCNVQANLEDHGYKLERVEPGHFDEWTGYFRRTA